MAQLQTDLGIISNVSRSWNLGLNRTKYVIMRFGRSSVNEEGSGSGYYADGVELKLVKSHRDLDVIVDHTLKFHSHVSTLVNKELQSINKRIHADDFYIHNRSMLGYCFSV